jgi:hypothetical protein
MKTFTPVLVALALSCCDASGPTPSEKPTLEVAIAPLTLPGISKVCYDLRVTNGANGTGRAVWQKGDPAQDSPADTDSLCSSQFGNGSGGAVTFVGACDAAPASPGDTGRINSATLWVDSLHALGGGPISETGPEAWQDPCPAGCTLNTLCEENVDARVEFNLTILRQANQGFFDIGVNFDDIFCSAKVDCRDTSGEPLRLLFRPGTGTRDTTVVSAFACTAGPGRDTYLYRDAVTVTCGATVTPLSPSVGKGNAWASPSDDPAPTDAIWQYAVYAGDESLQCNGRPCNKLYWNVAVGLDPSFDDCTLTTTMTASDGPLSDFTTPASTTYPYIEVDVQLTDSAGLACGRHALDGQGEVTTTYTSIGGGENFDASLSGAGFAAPSVVDPNLCGGLTCAAGATCVAGRCVTAFSSWQTSTAVPTGAYPVVAPGSSTAPVTTWIDNDNLGGGWVLAFVVTNAGGVTADWFDGDFGIGTNHFTTVSTLNTPSLAGLNKVNAKHPLFDELAFSEIMIREDFQGTVGHKAYKLNSTKSFRERFAVPPIATYTDEVTAILGTSGTMGATFTSNMLMFNYQLQAVGGSNDGARIAATPAYNEATGGIAARVDASTGYSWRGNLTRSDSGRHYGAPGATTDHAVWIFVRLPCAPGTVACGGGCIDVNSNPDHCGACSIDCSTNSADTCNGGICQCQAPRTLCGGHCVDLGGGTCNSPGPFVTSADATGAPSGVYYVAPSGAGADPIKTYVDNGNLGGRWMLAAVVTNSTGTAADWFNGEFGVNQGVNHFTAVSTLNTSSLLSLQKSNAKHPLFDYFAFSELLIREDYQGTIGYKAYALNASRSFRTRFLAASNATYTNEVSSILGRSGTMGGTFSPDTLMFNYQLTNDGARLAATAASNEATGGIVGRVDGGTGYVWKGNLTRSDSGRHFNSAGATADHTVWLFVR